MATQQLNPNIKEVSLVQVSEDLDNGLTKWKKDDIGFGSLEKKYSLTMPEMIELLNHPRVKLMETRIPTFRIIDDLPVEEGQYQPEPFFVPSELTLGREVQTTSIQTEKQQPKKKIEAFI